jgi:hypothetical protein
VTFLLFVLFLVKPKLKPKSAHFQYFLSNHPNIIAAFRLVTGVDGDLELVEAAKQQNPDGEFESQDLRSLHLPKNAFDGLWCSFTAAYFTDFRTVFSSWIPFLKEKAWVCVTDVDDLLGHEPLSENSKKAVQDFYGEAFQSGRYDFKAGGKIQEVLETEGFRVISVDLEDHELSFSGPAPSDVQEAWLKRFDRMGGLKRYFGEEFNSFQKEFVESLSSRAHRSRCRVICCLGTRA